MSPIDRLLERLEGVVRSGRGFAARCPAHDDDRPSLSITPAPDGKVLLNCFAGCAPEDVLAALDLTFSDLYPDVPAPAGPSHDVVATYNYVDEHDTLLYQVVRRRGKRFSQRRPDGYGGWIHDTRGVRPVLYNLPWVLAAVQADHTIFVVEGEKDVHTLGRHGFTATCNRGGAGKWQASYAEALRGARVVVLPDNDPPGRRHADDVARSLHGVAREVRLLELPGLPPKGDVSDWFAAGGTPEALKALVRTMPPYTSLSVPSDDGPQIGVLVADVTREKIEWLWPGRLAKGKLTILDGDPGLGKSTLYCDLAARITRGRSWPDGTPCPRGGVVIVTTEDGIADTIRPRLEEAGADLSRCLVVQTVQGDGGLPRVPVLPDDLPLFEHAIRRVGARLLVIDPLMAHLGGDINSYRDQDVRRALAPLSEFAERMGVVIVVIRHLNKMSGGRALYRGGGSIGIIGAARVGLLVGRDPGDESRVLLACAKNNIAHHPPTLAFRVVPSPHDPDTAVIQWYGTSTLSADDLCRPPAGDDNQSALEEAKAWLVERLADGPRPAAKLYEEAEAAGLAERTLKRARGKVADAERTGGLGREGFWVWTLKPAVAAKEATKNPKKANPVDGTLSILSGTNGHGSSLHHAFHRDQRVRTPAGEARVLQAFMDQITVHVSGEEHTRQYAPDEVSPV